MVKGGNIGQAAFGKCASIELRTYIQYFRASNYIRVYSSGRPKGKYFNHSIMGEKAKKSGLARIPALGLSSLTFFASVILAFLLDRISSTELSAFSTTKIIPMIFYAIVIAGASFFICRTHPRSVWYTPFICNALGAIVGIIGTLDDPNFIRTFSSFWIVFSACLLLSIIAAIIGARTGSPLDKKA